MAILLHGTLLVRINEAKGLPDTDNLLFFSNKDRSDPYVSLEIGKIRLLKTAVVNDNLNPKWNEYFRADVAQVAENLLFRIKDKDLIGSNSLGVVKISAQDLLDGGLVEGWFDVVTDDGQRMGAQLNLSVTYQSVQEATKFRNIPDCYFIATPDNKVTLYQDADTPGNSLFSSIVLCDDRAYQAARAWRDIHEAISNARRLIYLTGWSVNAYVMLLRDETFDETLGTLLKRKASEGVRVLLLIWDDRLSTDVTDGLGTHDNQTALYFKNSNVRVALVPRQKRLAGFIEQNWAATCYSHHQKTIIVDSELPEIFDDNRRRLVAFVGGLDLTDGRWDTQQHALFATLNTTHKHDFYQTCFKVNQMQGPRQPWHDVHMKIEGPAALDVLKNFEERWRRQVKHEVDRLIEISEDDFIIDFPGPCKQDEDKWQVQLLRSINSDSVRFNDEKKDKLFYQKGRLTDNSIHRGYVHHIRRAKRYIYIENQYFLGSSHEWLADPNSKAPHMIPYEIAEAICKKIRLGERFACYIVMPMFPEGDPHGAPLQAILFWQYRTMELMYRKIATAISDSGLEDARPTDYLLFFCLGNREIDIPDDLPPPPPPFSVPGRLRESRRHQIYVHSKMMIVDDECIIIGSANINQRSMGGNRDTEIAICAFQPAHTQDSCNGQMPRSDIYGFRMALWAEHTDQILPDFDDPSSISCARALYDIGEANWNCYADNKVMPLKGHLLLYPLQVHSDGTLTTLPNCEHFPDTSAPISGTKSSIIPLSVTT